MRLGFLLLVLLTVFLTACGQRPGTTRAAQAEHQKPKKRAADHDHSGHKHANHGDENADDEKKLKIGEPVPDFEVTIDGKPCKFSELRQRKELAQDGVLVFTFWCSFCHSCRDVEQEVERMAQKYQGRAGVIALDASAGETTEQVQAFAAEQGLTFPIALSENGAAADLFNVRKTTTTIVVDKDGVLRYRGQFRKAEEALTAVLVGEEVPTPETKQFG